MKWHPSRFWHLFHCDYNVLYLTMVWFENSFSLHWKKMTVLKYGYNMHKYIYMWSEWQSMVISHQFYFNHLNNIQHIQEWKLRRIAKLVMCTIWFHQSHTNKHLFKRHFLPVLWSLDQELSVTLLCHFMIQMLHQILFQIQAFQSYFLKTLIIVQYLHNEKLAC